MAKLCSISFQEDKLLVTYEIHCRELSAEDVVICQKALEHMKTHVQIAVDDFIFNRFIQKS